MPVDLNWPSALSSLHVEFAVWFEKAGMIFWNLQASKSGNQGPKLKNLAVTSCREVFLDDLLTIGPDLREFALLGNGPLYMEPTELSRLPDIVPNVERLQLDAPQNFSFDSHAYTALKALFIYTGQILEEHALLSSLFDMISDGRVPCLVMVQVSADVEDVSGNRLQKLFVGAGIFDQVSLERDYRRDLRRDYPMVYDVRKVHRVTCIVTPTKA
jgi:hypothetical protein